MSVPLWVSETAEQFWVAAGGEPHMFPRDLRPPIARALPLTVVLLPRLCVANVDAWLREHAGWSSIGILDRALRACLIAYHGHGVMFLDGADPDDEQRFSLAHELAHFLRDYLHIREAVRARLGDDVLEVLDGERPPSYGERAQALLARGQIGVHIDLIDRADDEQPTSSALDIAEAHADLLAYALLAPASSVLIEARSFEDHD